MAKLSAYLTALVAVIPAVLAQSPIYGQCGVCFVRDIAIENIITIDDPFAVHLK